MLVKTISLYKNRTDANLTTYVLDDSPQMLAGKPRPAILICPGGGYMFCSDNESEPIALRFAAMGYHAFVLRYSAYMEGKKCFPPMGEPLEVKPDRIYPLQMREIGMAMRIIREHAEEWLVDTDRIALCGFSAGAHNCAMYATNWHRPVITDYLNCEAETVRPAALILSYTLSDYVYMKKKSAESEFAKRFFEDSNMAFMGKPDAPDEVLAEVSPARNVSGFMPPTFLWATAEDNLIPVQHSIRMAHALADHHIPFELHIFESGEHGLALATQASASARTQINPEAAKWIELADTWLMKRFALDLKEKEEFQRE